MIPPRTLAIVTSIDTKAKGYLFATDQQRREYFIHRTNCETAQVFASLTTGDQISFVGEDGPKGYRGTAVRVMSEDEEALFTDQQGNTATVGEDDPTTPPRQERPARRR